jgi:hypothetical protein
MRNDHAASGVCPATGRPLPSVGDQHLLVGRGPLAGFGFDDDIRSRIDEAFVSIRPPHVVRRFAVVTAHLDYLRESRGLTNPVTRDFQTIAWFGMHLLLHRLSLFPIVESDRIPDRAVRPLRRVNTPDSIPWVRIRDALGCQAPEGQGQVRVLDPWNSGTGRRSASARVATTPFSSMSSISHSISEISRR